MSKKIFIIGIGGKGLNGIAKICLERGYSVSGVDTKKTSETVSLEKAGAKIFYKHSEKNISENLDEIVYSSIAKDSPEILAAQKLKIKVTKRSAFLKKITENNFRICVSGSHGKSTTVALLGLSTINSGIDSTIFGGAYTKEFNGYNHLGNSDYAIIEACEYDRSFHDLIGHATIITSLEKSHLEYYRDEEEMLESFRFFVEQHDKKAIIVANGDNIKIRKITSNLSCRVLYFGFNEINDYKIRNVKKEEFGSIFSIYKGEEKIINNLKINIPGDYNILNFAACAAMMNSLKIPLYGIRETAMYFTGVGRRFEIHKTKSGHTFIDDFAHHPSQVKSLFDGIKQFYPHKKVCAVFQPRQFNLMQNFIKEYGESFKKADEVILTEIMPALGDTPQDIASISSLEIKKSIQKLSGKPVKLIDSFSEITTYLKLKYDENSIIATIGAGDIYKIRDQFVSQS